MINGIDYNGKHGRHPNNCDCIKHQSVQPMPITKGENKVTTPIYNDAIIAALVKTPDLLKEYMESVANTPIKTDAPNVETTQIPVPNQLIPEFVAGQTEYIIPCNIDLTGKPDSMAKLTDARNHAEKKFTNGIHDFRFPKGYASRSIVATGKWGLKLFRME